MLSLLLYLIADEVRHELTGSWSHSHNFIGRALGRSLTAVQLIAVVHAEIRPASTTAIGMLDAVV